jgi:hypothetical protein
MTRCTRGSQSTSRTRLTPGSGKQSRSRASCCASCQSRLLSQLARSPGWWPPDKCCWGLTLTTQRGRGGRGRRTLRRRHRLGHSLGYLGEAGAVRIPQRGPTEHLSARTYLRDLLCVAVAVVQCEAGTRTSRSRRSFRAVSHGPETADRCRVTLRRSPDPLATATRIRLSCSIDGETMEGRMPVAWKATPIHRELHYASSD